MKVDLNTKKLEELLENHELELKKSFVIPKWFLWMVGVIVSLLAIQSFCLYVSVFIE
ncbi:MAG: hypothetical protein K9G70_14090 [Prolixibacteraceae bacterium]|nr:hypothetical protein [Prolixibacteraceae bacterium]